MLTLTPAAARAVQTLVTFRKLDDETGGLRIARAEAPEAGSSLALAVVGRPEPADAEIESGGAHVFVAPALGAVLDDKVLDAGFGGGSVRFALLAP